MFRAFAVANETPVCQRRIRRNRFCRTVNLFHAEVEAAGVATIGYAPAPRRTRRYPDGRSGHRGFTWRAVQAKAAAGLVFPTDPRPAQADAPQLQCLYAKLLAVVQVFAAEQRVIGFTDTNVAQRWTHDHFKDFRHKCRPLSAAFAAGAFHIQDRRDAGFTPSRRGDTGHQRSRQRQTFIQQFPECGSSPFASSAMRAG